MSKLRHPIVDPDVTRRTPVPEVIQYSRHLQTTLSADPRFAGLASLIATLETDTNDLEKKQGPAMTKAVGSAEARNTPLGKVHTDIDNICQAVQALVDANPGQGEEYATAAAMHLRKQTRAPKPWLAAKMVKGTPGSARLKAKAVKRGACYEWQMSTDDKSWVMVGSSTVANWTVTGLSAGSTYYFRFRTTIGHVTGDFTQALSFMAT
jgi:hypothetical protein